jgi:DNA-binding PadR family transcriptional regulator
MLEMAILGLLHDSSIHGYDLRKNLRELLGPFRAFSYGSLYPALKRMEAEGLIRSEDGTQPPSARNALAGSASVGSKRAKRVYEITPEGRERFIELVSDTGPRNYTDDGFGLRLAFFRFTTPEVRMRILEGRRRQVEQRRDTLRETLAKASAGLRRYTAQLQQLALESTEREVGWLNELIAAEIRGESHQA